jgi:hypothetical protein
MTRVAMSDRRRRAVPIAVIVALVGAAVAAGAQVIETNGDLLFGKLAVGPAPGTVTITAAGTRTSAGGTSLVGSTCGAARFGVTGTPTMAFGIVLPSSISLASGAAHMTVDGFQSLPSGTGVFDGSGHRDLQVGATLHVNAGQARGAYAGSFDVTVAYE